jgi:transcriptional regulator with XRE-family HTH domain
MSTRERLPLGNRVRKRREELGLTRERLAIVADVSTSMIARLELSNRLPGTERLVRIARVLGISLDDELLDGPEQASA